MRACTPRPSGSAEVCLTAGLAACKPDLLKPANQRDASESSGSGAAEVALSVLFSLQTSK